MRGERRRRGSIDVVSRQSQEDTPAAAETPLARPSVQVPLSAVSRMRGLIEIVLPGGTSVRVDAHSSPACATTAAAPGDSGSGRRGAECPVLLLDFDQRLQFPQCRA